MQDIVSQNELKLEKPIKMLEVKRFKTPELKYIEGNLFKTQSTKYEQKVENLSMFLAKNQYTEIEYIAKEITKLVKEKKKRYNDIAIITKNIQSYSNLARVILKSMIYQYL